MTVRHSSVSRRPEPLTKRGMETSPKLFIKMKSKTSKVKCVTDWSHYQSNTVKGNVCVLLKERFSNGEFVMTLRDSNGTEFISPSVFWEPTN